MVKPLLKICLFLVLILSQNCANQIKQTKVGIDNSVTIDTILIKDFLKDPRNNLKLHKLDYETECQLSENQKSLNSLVTIREYYDCEYWYKGIKIAETKSSTYKTDSTWALGTNGLVIHSFMTDEPKFPLKNELNIGSKIESFIKFFWGTKKTWN